MKKLPQDQINEIIKQYIDGKSPLELSEKFGIRNNSITRLLRKNGIERNQKIKVSQDKIKQIIFAHQAGTSSEEIAKNFNIDGSTVCRILKRNGISVRSKTENQVKIDQNFIKHIEIKQDNSHFESKNIYDKYGTLYTAKYNDQQLTSKYLKTISDEEKERMVDCLFNFYRENGFPYTKLTNNEIYKDFTSLINVDLSKIENNKILSLNNPAGIDVFKHFAPHFFEVKSGRSNKLSMLESFNDDDSLKKVIKNRLLGNFNMTGNMLKQGLATSKVAYKASIFNPSIAKCIYSKFVKEDDIIYDYSMGFGQRLLGAMSLPFKVKYIGVDPYQRSIDGGNEIYQFLNSNIPGFNKEVDLACIGSENYCNSQYIGKVSFAFSSPPYFKLEKYENNEAQAYHNGDYCYFINDWWKKTVENTKALLKDNGIFAVNVCEKVFGFNLAEDMCNLLKDYGFVYKDEYKIQLTKNVAFGGRGEHKFEPIYIFEKQ